MTTKSSFLILFFLFLLSGLPSGCTTSTFAMAAADSDSLYWSLELENGTGNRAALNNMWCSSPTGDLAFGPVPGANTSAPDASIWAVTQSADQFLLHLRLPSTIDYSCRLETRLADMAASSLWSFELPLSTLNQDNYTSGDITCRGSWHAHWHPEVVPPSCQLYGVDGFSLASVVVSLLTPSPSDATGETAPSYSSASAPAPAPDASPSSQDGASSSPSPTTRPSSPAPTPVAAPSAASSPPTSSSPSPASPPSSTAPAPPRKLLGFA